MDWRDIALLLGGIIGGAVALVHGGLAQRLMVGPIDAVLAAQPSIRGVIRRLTPPLLHVSTFDWFVSGLAVIAAALWLEGEARLGVCALAGAIYLYAAIANCIATRGRHPGWVLMSVALALIVIGVWPV